MKKSSSIQQSAKRSAKQRLAETIATLDGPRDLCQTWGRFLKKGQGTFASLLAMPFWLLLNALNISWPIYLSILVAVTFVGVWATRIYEAEFGGADLPEVVIDEFVGMGIALFFVPMISGYIALAFGLFRLFDIWKPAGVKYFDDHHFHSWGVMLDDVVAGIYALIILQTVYFFVAEFR